MTKLQKLIEKLEDKGLDSHEVFYYLSTLGIIGIWVNDLWCTECNTYRQQIIEKQIDDLLVEVDFMKPNWKLIKT